MSTADLQLLVIPRRLAEDFYKAILKKHASDSELCGSVVVAPWS
jgi:Na+/proline symporter